MVSLKDTAKADNISLSEYLKISRKNKLKKANNIEQYNCQVCPYGQMASDQHVLCLLPKCQAKMKASR